MTALRAATWTNHMRAFRVANDPETGFKNESQITLPLIPDFYQKVYEGKYELKILQLNSRKKHFNPHSVLGEKTFRKPIFFFQNFFHFPGYGRASQGWVERNVDVRPKTQQNGAEAPLLLGPETQGWCVI